MSECLCDADTFNRLRSYLHLASKVSSWVTEGVFIKTEWIYLKLASWDYWHFENVVAKIQISHQCCKENMKKTPARLKHSTEQTFKTIGTHYIWCVQQKDTSYYAIKELSMAQRGTFCWLETKHFQIARREKWHFVWMDKNNIVYLQKKCEDRWYLIIAFMYCKTSNE